MTRRPKAPRVPEKVVQAQCVRLLQSLGGQVWVTGTRRPRGDYQGTCSSPGIPDVLASLRGRFLFLECKAKGGKLRPEQAQFRDAALACGVDHIVGGVDELVAYLIGRGLLRDSQVAHYRVPAAPVEVRA